MLPYLRTWLRTVIKDQRGQDLAEYALLIALIAIVVIVAVTFLGQQVKGIFNSIANTLNKNLQ
jgi:pilus assembly protein Flp/PilA